MLGAHLLHLAHSREMRSTLTEVNRPGRVEGTMPAFRSLIQQLRKDSGVTAEITTLIGFSQGSIMSLETTQTQSTLAAHVIAIS